MLHIESVTLFGIGVANFWPTPSYKIYRYMSKYAFKTIIQYLLIYNEFENLFEKTTFNTIAYIHYVL